MTRFHSNMAKHKAQFEFVGKSWSMPIVIAQQIGQIISNLRGKNIRVTVEEVRKKRSNKQNAYYWGVVVPAVHGMFLETGNVVDQDEVHEFLKRHVGKLTCKITDPNGHEATVTRSSAKEDTSEFEKYMEAIRSWAAQFDLEIPLPNEEEIWVGILERTDV